ATAPEDDLKPSDYPPWMGIQDNMTNRAWRALETFGADPMITAQAFRRYKFDISYSARSEVASMIREACTHPDADLAEACKLLVAWNRSADIHSRAAALAILMAVPVSKARHDHDWSLTPAAALRKAQDALKTHFGRIDPQWGEVNRIRRGALDLAI